MISTRPNGTGIPADIAARFTRAGVGPQDAPQVPKVLQLYPWWLYKPPQGQDIVTLGENLFLGAGSIEIPGTVTQLDQNTMAIIKGIDLYVNNLLPTSNIVFSLLVNGGQVAGYGQMAIFPRTAASVTMSFDTNIYCPAGARISVQVTDSDGGGYLVGAGYQGWSVPVNIDSILGIDGGVYA